MPISNESYQRIMKIIDGNVDDALYEKLQQVLQEHKTTVKVARATLANVLSAAIGQRVESHDEICDVSNAHAAYIHDMAHQHYDDEMHPEKREGGKPRRLN